MQNRGEVLDGGLDARVRVTEVKESTTEVAENSEPEKATKR